MLKIENCEVLGWEHAIRGMRNPMNSWEKSDSGIGCISEYEGTFLCKDCESKGSCLGGSRVIGPNDHGLMIRLRNAGTDHRKFMRMIVVYCDITAPLYWWKEFDTYKVGTVANSCSTMHKIHAKDFTLEDFSCEHLMNAAMVDLGHVIDTLNYMRKIYLYGGELCDKHGNWTHFESENKEVWWQMIQLLPSSYNQRRTVQMNYEVLTNIYKSRKGHRLDEWKDMLDWIETLPYSELIVGERSDGSEKFPRRFGRRLK